ncbi:hypothetical protein [Neptuniibacter sp. QD37_11]|uniref:hypothetical protein n=1 Tax=Neptuniibacter sp. QD37_11 TaxID=3398209 RepID=UPI0039F5F0C2
MYQVTAENQAKSHFVSPSVCQCGVPWENSCRCPESILERFSESHGKQRFYYTDLANWMRREFSFDYWLTEGDIALIRSVLALDGVVRHQNGVFETPYEL